MAAVYDRIFIHHPLSKLFNAESPYSVQRLPIQLLIDLVITHLSVGDIIALRKVNAAFFLLTHEPIIWRRVLKTFNCPPPCLTDYAPYTLQPSDFKIERMVRNFLSVQRNWESPNPSLCGYHAFPTSCKVLEMKILPGGEYAVAAVSDEHGYRVMVTGLDGKLFGLASLSTIARPYNLQAQVMAHDGRNGVMVWFLVASDFEMPKGVQKGYTCHIAHICLNTLETRYHKNPPSSEPFELLIPYTFEDPVHDATVFVLGSALYISVVLLPGEVVIINVGTSEARSLICEPDPSYDVFDQQIRSARMLTTQGDVLVARTIVNGPNDIHLLELYSIPTSLGRFRSVAKARVIIEHKQVESFKFSETTVVDPFDSEPLPISLYLETENPRSIVHYTISPVQHHAYGAPRPWWCYDLTNVIQQSSSSSTQDIVHVLPGIHRAIVCTSIDEADSDEFFSPPFELTSFRRYFNPEIRLPDLLSWPREFLLRTQQLCGLRPKHLYRTIDISPYILRAVNNNRISTIAWDESSGRTCIATRHDRRFHVLEFGDIASPDDHLQRFESFKKILRIGEYARMASESPYSEMEMLDVIDLEDIPDDVPQGDSAYRSFMLLLMYLVLGLSSMISLYSSLCIRQAILRV